jgi:hypothetical protein
MKMKINLEIIARKKGLTLDDLKEYLDNQIKVKGIDKVEQNLFWILNDFAEEKGFTLLTDLYEPDNYTLLEKEVTYWKSDNITLS